jgi:alanyl-tRNA synthetase
VSGKHNDLEEVGIDTYHHTMFEMLGNWSFGDYFKKDAIAWAWELLTKEFGLPEDRLYVTVFEGDKNDGLNADDEAKSYWQSWVPEERILLGSKKDNFWEMGDTGPCGPCSEIHIDLRSEEEIKKVPGDQLVNQDHPRVVEVWNLVFIEFNRKSNGALESLPEKHVDTGMGFERLAMAIQNKSSNYDTDVFQPLIKKVTELSGKEYGKEEKIDVAIRVVVDHIRAIAFAVSDGQIPGNVKAGYVIRRILRRAVRYGYTFLGFDSPFLHKLIPILSDQFDDVFPELKAQEEFVSKVIKEEEVSFLRTLDQGLKRFETLKVDLKGNKIPGTSVFELYDTYGFPVDLTSLIARENGLEVNLDEFESEMAKQKERSKAAAKEDKSDWTQVQSADTDSEFIGYEYLNSESRIIRYREVQQKGKKFYQVVLDITPFYAESGGQVGDRGLLQVGVESIEVFDTKRENESIIHYTRTLPGNLDAAVVTHVDETKRASTQCNHSATHLVHAALRQVLGDHVQQRGSLVNEDVLRFDFSHFSKMTDEEISRVEEIVNSRIRENIALDEKRHIPIDKAREMGAMALFGEKYGEFVRVITFNPDFSVELCGGTHVNATGTIGMFKIISESSIAAGVRRIEALTGHRAESYVNERLSLIKELDTLLKSPKDLIKSVESLIKERQDLTKTLEVLNNEKARTIKKDILDAREEIGPINLIVYQGSFPNNDSIKQLAFELKNEIDDLLLVIGGDVAGKPNLTVMISDNLVKEYDLNAGQMIRELARHIKGGGGGQPFYATAGGKDVNGVKDALADARKQIENKLASLTK